MSEWVMIGVPSSAGAHHAGQELAPDALRAAGLADRLRGAGAQVTDAGNLQGAVFAADRGAAARNLAAVTRVAAEVAEAVAGSAATGQLPLLIGGDCTITIGAVAGLRRGHADVGLAYVDGDADVEVPGDGGSGVLDSMGISHLLGRGAPELAGLDGSGPLLDGTRLAILGSDPRETSDAGRRWLADAGASLCEAPDFVTDPTEAARSALSHLAGADRVLVHFDVDVVDSGDLPLGNFPHYGSGVLLVHAMTALRVLRADPRFAGLVLTEVNPTHDPGGAELRRLVDGLAAALAD